MAKVKAKGTTLRKHEVNSELHIQKAQRLSADFSTATLQARREAGHRSSAKGKAPTTMYL